MVEHGGRYYVVDWKSNWLGDDDDAYHPGAMRATMLEHRYDLQYALYLLALHRQLRARLPGYDYERHVGGAVYAFRAEGGGAAARRAERAVRFRNRWLGLPSGAQGMAIRRRFLVHLGGVPDLERGEDLVLARRLGLGRLTLFDVGARVPPAGGPAGPREATGPAARRRPRAGRRCPPRRCPAPETPTSR